jgi:hypothetical protein
MQHPIGLSPTLGILQNDMAALIADDPPFLDLFERSKTAEARKIIVQAAISNTRGWGVAVDITHLVGQN